MIKALIGLGNKGEEYAKTYHNAGAFVAQCIASEAGLNGVPRDLELYPLSGFMNASGPAVLAWMRQHNFSLDDVLVVHDESDLSIGAYKLVRGGGSAGHKGVESLIAAFGNEEFWRLRVGVRDPNEKIRRKADEFVLNQWSSADEEALRGVARKAWDDIKPLTLR